MISIHFTTARIVLPCTFHLPVSTLTHNTLFLSPGKFTNNFWHPLSLTAYQLTIFQIQFFNTKIQKNKINLFRVKRVKRELRRQANAY